MVNHGHDQSGNQHADLHGCQLCEPTLANGDRILISSKNPADPNKVGELPQFSVGQQIASLDAGQFYTVREVSGTTFKLALTNNRPMRPLT